MRKLIYYLIFLIAISNIAFSNNFELIPLVISFRGVEAKQDTIIAFGDYGSLLISNDNAANWKQVKVFNRGTILSIDWNDIKMVAFNDAGDIAVSIDKGITWNTVTNIQDSILAVIKYPDGYFIRARNKLFAISNNFISNKEFYLYSKDLQGIDMYTKKNYINSLINFNNELIAETDSSTFIRFNYNLEPIDTLSLKKLGIFDSTYQYLSGYNLATDSQYLYINVNGINNSDSLKYSTDTLYRAKDFKSIENFYNLNNLQYKIIDGQFFTFNKNANYLIDTTKETSKDYNVSLNDFTVVKNKEIVVGNNKIIEIIDLKDSNLNVVSEFANVSSFAPEKIADSSYLFFSGDYRYYLPYIYRTDNNGITFKPVVEHQYDSIYFNRYSNYTFIFKYFDDKEKKIFFGETLFMMGSQVYLLLSDDYCKSFIRKPIDGFYFQANPSSGYYKNANSLPNLQNNNENYIISDGFMKWQDTIYNGIATFDKDFKMINWLNTTFMVIDYVHSKDTNTFLIHCASTLDSTSEIKFTSNQGNNWETIKKYPISETCQYYKEIACNNQQLLALIHYNNEEQSYRLDVINLDNNQFDSIYKWKNYNNIQNWSNYGVGIESDSGIVYITFQDTLFYTIDLFDRNKWHYQILPNNGRIISRPFKKFGDKFFVCYLDDNSPYNNSLWWLKLLEPITKVDDFQILDVDYLYAFPPYPIPGYNHISFHLFWDLCDDIDNDEINVFNILGNKIAGREKFSINKASLYDGFLTWDCSDMSTGTYFIQIKKGNYSTTVKAIVFRDNIFKSDFRLE